MIFFGTGRGGCGLLLGMGLLLLVLGGGGGGGGGVFLLMILIGLIFLIGIPLSAGSRTRSGSVRGYSIGGSPYAQPDAGWSRPPDPVLPQVSGSDVSSLRDRLGHDVRSLDPGGDPVARQAMADASERYATGSTLLERATSDAQLRTAWLAVVEGLAATQVVRQRLGLDLGPPVPALPVNGPRLTERAHVQVEGRDHVGSPTYEPGRPHWFPGGYYDGRPVPSGWYGVPFWPSALLLGGLTGWMLGGLGAGAMYGDDVAGGWGDGGDFGGFGGGGDWGGGGGGDWGGFGGGGDFGGGDW